MSSHRPVMSEGGQGITSDSPPTWPTEADDFAPLAAPKSIGPYQLLEQIGSGGMGIVYRARQTAPLVREVALKLIKLGMDTREVVTRFDSEKQTLAILDHPGIAKVFDAGASETGRPYFVMELVSAAEPITRYCDRHQL